MDHFIDETKTKKRQKSNEPESASDPLKIISTTGAILLEYFIRHYIGNHHHRDKVTLRQTVDEDNLQLMNNTEDLQDN